MITQERVWETFKTFNHIDSESGHEHKMADHLIAEYAKLGVTLTEDDGASRLGTQAGNLYGMLPANAEGFKPVLFSSHMDTVVPGNGKKAVLHDDGKITSDGTTVLGADDIAGLTSILEAVREIVEQDIPHGDIEFLFTVQEENMCLGSSIFDFSRIRSKRAYVLDLDGPIGTAAHQAPSIFSLHAVIRGKSSHAGFIPEQGIHAIKAAADAISVMRLGHVDEQSTANIGIISGGKAVNIVPDECTLEGEVRSFSHENGEMIVEGMRTILETVCKKYGAKLEFESHTALKAFEVPENDVCVKRFKKVCEKARVPYELIRSLGGSDLNRLSGEHKIPGLVVACGMNACHTTKEWSTISELTRSANLTYLLMTEPF